MPGISLYTSNKLERLLEILTVNSGKNHPGDALIPEIIIVQNQGMARWLALELAGKLGICANYQFLFPNKFIEDIFKDTLPDYAESIYDDIGTNTWRIFTILQNLSSESEFGAVRMYLQDDREGLKAYQLANNLANLYDQYTIYRPELILDWENKQLDNWQAIIWHKMAQYSNFNHRAKLFQKFFNLVQSGTLATEKLAKRVSLFGISSLPPLYIQFFEALSKYVDIDFYILNPCREYWLDILSDKETARIAGKTEYQELPQGDLHLTTGNSLLASMGKQGRDFLYLLSDYDNNSFFEQPGEQTLLSVIQSDILNFRDRKSGDEPPLDISSGDDSVEVHICHSERREIEVLYDKLLGCFDNNSGLLPRDIVVMTPDIERYTPYIQAVFGNPENQNHRIPFTIADRELVSESGVIDTFFNVLNLSEGRYNSSDIMAILESEVVYKKYELNSYDIELITNWLKKVNIRWGKNADHKKSLGLPGDAENTWEFGLNRLILGYALPGENELIYDGILPYDNIEGEQAVTLGKFAEFITNLFNRLEYLSVDMPLEKWVSCLINLCDELFYQENKTEQELQVLRRAIYKLSHYQESCNLDYPVSLKVVKQYLLDQLSQHSSTSGFIAGSVTFCAMLPMRSIPFKVVCLIGMNNTDFPRQARHYSFDMIANKPRIGDRSTRHTDRYLFLEALLSARQKLYISYIGQSITDNNSIPPSVVISELLDYIKAGFTVESPPLSSKIEIPHKLQAFNHEYFVQGSRLSSYSNENYIAAQSRLEISNAVPEFITNELPPLEDDERTVDINDLWRFFSNPAKYLLTRRLGIYLDEVEKPLEYEEPQALTGLIRYHLANDLLDCYLRDDDIQKRYNLARADGVLPHGEIGKIDFEQLATEISPVAEKVKPLIGDIMPALELDLNINNYKITGKLENIFRAGVIHYKAGNINKKDTLSIWIKFISLCLTGNGDISRQAILIGCNETVRFNAPEKPENILNEFIELYNLGMRKPLTFFPESSYRYAWEISKDKSIGRAIQGALSTWAGSDYSRGEGDDPYYNHCFKNLNLADQAFRSIAKRVYLPIINSTDTK